MRELVKAFKALSDETRLRILGVLMERECCVCEVMQALEISQTRASRNLALLYDAGFLKLRREGLWALYSIDWKGMRRYASDLLEAVQNALPDNDMVLRDRERLRKAVRLGPGCLRAATGAGAGGHKVLFVCVHNSGRSQMAEAFFNSLAKGRGVADSAGTQPAARVNPVVVEAMKEVGLDIGGNQPKMLTTEMVQQADKVITMGCSIEEVCPLAFVEAGDWGLEDPAGKPPEVVRRIRDEIRERVVKMLEGAGP